MVASRFITAAAALILSVAALPAPSHAQASREGPTFAAAGAWPGFGLRFPDVAYDPVNNVYLAVASPMAHGRFQTADGVPVGTNEFYISSSGAYNQTTRVEYGGRQVPGHVARRPERSRRQPGLRLRPLRQLR